MKPRLAPFAIVLAIAVLAAASLIAVGCSGRTQAASLAPAPNLGDFVPTPTDVAERMLALAGVTRDDVVYDLGSGDGRIVILAARRHGARGVGVEINPQLVWFSRRAAQQEQVGDLVTFVNADALSVDLSPATVVTLYLSPQANLLLRPILQRELRPGARVVSHAHDMGDWAPARVDRVVSTRGEEHVLYLWRIER